MSKFKKWLIGLGLVLSLVLLLGSCNYFFARPMYYRLFYPWDRVTGTVQVELDGEPAAFTVEGETLRSPIRGEGSARISDHANDYDVYAYTIRIDGVEQPIELSLLKWNWKVIRFDVRIIVDRSAGTVTYTGSVRETNDQGEFFERNVYEEASLSEEKISFPISW